MRKGAVVFAMVALCCSALSAPASAETGDKQLRFGLLFSSPMDDYSETGQTTEFDDSTGLLVAFEYWVTDRIGIEPSLGTASYDIGISETGIPNLDFGQVDLLGLNVSANFHVLPDSRFDLFVAPTLGYAMWGDIESDVFLQDVPTGDEFVYGFTAGVDVPFGKEKWAFTGGLNYMFSDVTIEGSSAELGVSPLNLRVGAAYRF